MYKKAIRWIIVVFCALILDGCIESFDFQTESFESILVIEATITDEVTFQEIILSRTFRFEEEGPAAEEGAIVRIFDDTGIEYVFEEDGSGVYTSTEEFGANLGREYRLLIETSNGNSYISDTSALTGVSPVNDLYPVQMTNDDNEEGIGILIGSFDPEGNSVYYRYEYEETYRIIAPDWRTRDVVVVSENPVEFGFVSRPEEQKICYKTEISNEIIIFDTNSLAEDRVDDFMVRFIKSDDISIADRYTILVRQFIQSKEANGFYKQLNDFSSSDNLFSQVQPGFIVSNIVSENNPDEKVLGFFDVSSVSEMRIFFNRDDVIQDLPIFTLSCNKIEPTPGEIEPIEDFLRRLVILVNSGRLKYLEGPAGSIFVDRPCGDCTALGESQVPEFWID